MLKVDDPRLSDVTEDTIARLIDRFYGKVRQNPDLQAIFLSAIPPDAWPAHLATMRRFWSSVMLASGRYSGNPVAVHRAVPDLDRPMFAHWLALFEQTAQELFVPEIAREFTTKAQRIAVSLQLALFHRPGQSPEGLPLPPVKPASPTPAGLS